MGNDNYGLNAILTAIRHTDLLMVIAWLSPVECTANLNVITKKKNYNTNA
jgi:hypothetical protein